MRYGTQKRLLKTTCLNFVKYSRNYFLHMYQCLDPWWNKTRFHLPVHTAGSECLQRMFSVWNEELFLKDRINHGIVKNLCQVCNFSWSFEIFQSSSVKVLIIYFQIPAIFQWNSHLLPSFRFQHFILKDSDKQLN